MKYTEASSLIYPVTDKLNDYGVYAWCGFSTVILSSILSMEPENFADYQEQLKVRLKEFEARASKAGYFRKT